MNIYTSRFYNKNITSLPNTVLVSIALYNPINDYPIMPSTKLYNVKELAPHHSLLMSYRNGDINEKQYTDIFNKKLKQLSKKKIVKKINKIALGKDVVLLCHCPTDKFCHRHLVAKWLMKNTKIQITELSNKSLVVNKQFSLF